MTDPKDTAPPTPSQEGGLKAPPGLSRWGKFWSWLRFWLFVKTARLRFIVVLVAVGGVIAYWDTLNAWYAKWVRPAADHDGAAADTEFFCPMHASIINDKPSK